MRSRRPILWATAALFFLSTTTLQRWHHPTTTVDAFSLPLTTVTPSTPSFLTSATTLSPLSPNPPPSPPLPAKQSPNPLLRTCITTLLTLTLLLTPILPTNALTEQQLLVDDVWREVTRQYVDKTYNNLGEDRWRAERLKAVKAVSSVGPDDTEAVYGVIRDMLGRLGDPYTRFLTPEQLEGLTSFAKGSQVGGKGGIGVQLMADPRTGGIVVMNVVGGGPAEKGGVLPGDVIEEVDGEGVDGATADVVAARCRGDVDSVVSLVVRHAGNDGNGNDGKKASSGRAEETIRLTRATISTESVQASVFESIDDDRKKVGLVRISGFNLETESKVSRALDELRSRNTLSALVLDLRSNPGGYMPAGVSLARLFLPRSAVVTTEIDRTDRAVVYTNDGVGVSETTLPLFILVDRRTASASEIATAALQDNGRATVVGMDRTFGKGRIQNIQGPLGVDGSGIAVTKARYVTPKGRDINGVGITVDVGGRCGSDEEARVCLKGLL